MILEKEIWKQRHIPYPQFRAQSISPFNVFADLKDTVAGRLFASAYSLFHDMFYGESPVVVYQRGLSVPRQSARIFEYLKKKNLITGFSVDLRYNDQPVLYTVRLTTPYYDVTDGHRPRRDNYNNGTAYKDYDSAFVKAAGKYLERYMFLKYRERDLVRASPKDLRSTKKKFLSPRALYKLSEAQGQKIGLQAPQDTDEFLWVSGYEHTRGEKTLLPAQAVFWTYNIAHAEWQEPFVVEQNTNGCAAYTDREKAISKAIYELVERDGFLIYWLNGIPPKRIDPASFSKPELVALVDECIRCQFEPHFLVTQTDLGIPSVAVALVNKSENGPKFVLGGGAGALWQDVAYSALIEALSVYSWCRESLDGGVAPLYLAEPAEEDLSVYGADERVFLWGNPRMFDRVAYFLKGEMVSVTALVDTPAHCIPSRELNYLLDIFRARNDEGYWVYALEARDKILEATGFFPVKVIIPELVPMYFREHTAPLSARRLREVPLRLGLATAAHFNEWPHPFP